MTPIQERNSFRRAAPRVLTDPTAVWRGEGVAISESDGTFAAISDVAYSHADFVRVNNELLDDVPTFAVPTGP